MRSLRSLIAVLVLLVGTLVAAQAPAALARNAAGLSDKVQLFYYPWYGSPTVNGSYRHWDQGGHTPPDDIGANYYPSLGAYDSGDFTGAVDQQMTWIARSGAGVIIYSWWGQGSYEDGLAAGVLAAAARHGIRVAWHIEPYGNRTATSVVSDVNYLNSRYGSSPAFYRDPAHGNKPAFYVFDSLNITDWSSLDSVTGANIVLAQTTDTSKVAHFNGMYTYDGIAAATAPGWASAGAYCHQHGMVWAPSVAPGYLDDRAVPGNTTPTVDRDNGAEYDKTWNNALDPTIGGSPDWVSVTSFNEWHEGSQIEPASSNPPAGHGYLTYSGAYGQTGTASSTAYLDRTKYWVDKFDPGAVAPSDVNLALGKTMTASGTQGGFPPGNANDNNTSSYWESSNNAFPQWLQVDLGASNAVNSITLTLPPSTAWGARTQTLTVSGSNDGATFSTLVASKGYGFDPASGNSVTISLPGSSQRYLRLTFTGNTGWPAGQVSEFQVYGTPSAPPPPGSPEQRADALLAQMTTDEKLTMMHGGASCGYGACVDPIPRLGIPGLHLQDGPAGVADGAVGVTQLPAPVAGAATWDSALMKQYGGVIGAEEWGKGANLVLGPTINIVRDPRWGRAFESLGEDPYLAGQLGAADLQGIRAQGPMTQVKHYAVYNQETYRNTSQDNAVVSDRTEQEIYLPAFQAAVQQGQTDSVMCSYAEINGTFACENGQLLNTILRQQLGFSGFVTSDWGGTHSTVASVTNGMDMEMDGSQYYGAALTQAVASGQVSVATIDSHVRAILVTMFRAGLFDHSPTGTINSVVTSDAHASVAQQVAQEGSVLLKNSNSLLPLGSGSIAVIGDDAGQNALTAGGGSAHVNAPHVVTPYQGIKSRAGNASVTYSQGVAAPNGEIVDPSFFGNGLSGTFYNGTGMSGTPILTRTDPNINFIWGTQSPTAGVPATNWSAKWTGTLTPPTTGTYTFSLTSDDGSRLFVNGQQVISNWADQPPTTKTGTISLTAGQPAGIEVDYFQDGGGSQLNLGWQIPNQDLLGQAVTAARGAGTAVVFVNNAGSEGGDLQNIDLSADQNTLVSQVAAANPNTVVVVDSGSAVTMPWASSVRGIVENWFPGQEDGTAIAQLLFGDANFSGKLPVTFPTSLSDVPASTTAQWPGQNGSVQYSEGVDVGYRWYDSQNKTPMFPFGFGLSYTTYGYGNLTVSTPDSSGNVQVGFDVTNTGSRAGTEVAQVYVGEPAATGEPPNSLRGFTRVTLNPGQTQHVSVTLDARSFQYWNNGWTKATGANTIRVGGSSRALPLTGSVTIS